MAELARFGVRVTVFVAPHTQTELGTRTEFRASPVCGSNTWRASCAIDTSPRRYAASPVYRMLLELAAWFPALMERKMVECVQHLFREPALIDEDGGAQPAGADTKV